MQSSTTKLHLLMCLATLLAGCGGGGSDDEAITGTPNPPSQNVLPMVSFIQPLAGEVLAEGGTANVLVDAEDTDGNIAHVTLSMNGTVIREDDTAPYEWGVAGSTDDISLRNLSPGNYELTAIAVDDDGGESTTTMTFAVTAAPAPPVNQPPSVSFTQPVDSASFDEGDTVSVNVVADDSDGSVAHVQLLLNGTLVRQENIAPYDWAAPNGTNDPALRNIAPGSYTLTAIATDDDGAEATAEIMITVQPGAGPNPGSACAVSGDLRQWHRAAVECTGFAANENDDATFTDYRFDVTFTQGGQTIAVPGHFAADGDAADSGATSGDTWRAYFSPPTTGGWQYTVAFRNGPEIAVADNSNSGTQMSVIDGTTGSFSVTAPPAASVDMRTRGLLQHNASERYLRFSGNGQIYIEAGMDSPENIFGYSDFDNTTKFSDAGSCKGILHDFAPHAADWNTGDPVWGADRGKNLIGLINYIASKGVNAVYIMANTVRGDGCDAHPWSQYNADGTVKRFDVSKLDQWERALTHMSANGLLIHVMTQETENDQLLNGGDLGLERKLYYRELVSRFGHHPALQWNLGEENTNTAAQQRAFADFIRQLDPYDHPIFMHTFPNQKNRYDALLGHPTFDGPTLQFGGIPADASSTNGVYGMAADWIERSTQAGQPWVVTFTEASGDDAPTPNTAVTSLQRVYWMWASVMSGGGGFEWYLKNAGAGHAYDLAVEDLREFDEHWDQSGHLARFFREIVQADLNIDLQQLTPDNAATSTNTDWVLGDSGNAYIIYLREGGSTDINLPDNSQYAVLWFNPRTGEQVAGNTLQGAGNQFLGSPPSQSAQDWAVVVSRTGAASPGAQFVQADGLVIMEAESTLTTDLGLWFPKTEVASFTGASYLEFDGNSALSGPPNSPLSYTFTITESGLHYLHLRVARETLEINGETRTDVANDAFVRLDGDYGPGPNPGNNHADDAPLSALQSDTKFFGGDDNRFVWASGNRLDLGGETNKRVAVYDLKAGETYTFTMSGRSRFFKVDRIVFRHESVPANQAQDVSRPESR